jgi:hypothetical protein
VKSLRGGCGMRHWPVQPHGKTIASPGRSVVVVPSPWESHPKPPERDDEATTTGAKEYGIRLHEHAITAYIRSVRCQ